MDEKYKALVEELLQKYHSAVTDENRNANDYCTGYTACWKEIKQIIDGHEKIYKMIEELDND